MRGGKRQGAGRRKGSKDPHTLAKEEARELARQHITKVLIPLLDAAIDHALGIKHFFKRNPTNLQSKWKSRGRIEARSFSSGRSDALLLPHTRQQQNSGRRPGFRTASGMSHKLNLYGAPVPGFCFCRSHSLRNVASRSLT